MNIIILLIFFQLLRYQIMINLIFKIYLFLYYFKVLIIQNNYNHTQIHFYF